MRLKFQNLSKSLLVAMSMQSVSLLLVHPMTNRFVLSRPNLCISLFLLIFLGYALTFSWRRDFKIELRTSKRFQNLRYLYFLMIASNAASLVLSLWAVRFELTSCSSLSQTVFPILLPAIALAWIGWDVNTG